MDNEQLLKIILERFDKVDRQFDKVDGQSQLPTTYRPFSLIEVGA
ncbi:hypothetical protein ACW2QC_18385 [Virgibacillus sp. FSP13]